MNGVWIGLFLISIGVRAATVCDAGDRDLLDAIHSADLYNWHDAEPKFSKARTELSRCHSQSKTLLASVGYLRATMEQRNLLELSRELNGLLSSAPADPLLRMASSASMHCACCVKRKRNGIESISRRMPA